MYRGQVSAVDGAGVYVLVPALHPTAPFGPLEHVGATPAVGARVLVVDCGGESEPDLVVLTGTGVTVSAGGGTVVMNGGAGNTYLYLDGDAGTNRGVRIRTGTATRWIVSANPDTESGGNAGGNLQFVRYDDSGNSLGTALQAFRDTGKVRIGAVGATAGIEMGAGGPTITSGTGAPSSSPPNGSIYLRTDGTASTTLYVRAAGAWSALS